MLTVIVGDCRQVWRQCMRYYRKQEFLRIAYIALKANSCLKIEKGKLALNINIFDKTCKKEDKNCDKSDLEDPDNTYDFKTIVWWICEAWIKNPEGYIWRFYNLETWEEIKKYWDYIDDYKFLSDWTWKIYLRVIDNCGNTWEVYNNIIIKEHPWIH